MHGDTPPTDDADDAVDDIIPCPPETVDNRHDAADRQDIHDRLESFVIDHATVTVDRQSTDRLTRRIVARVGVPFRVQSWSVNIDRGACADHDIDPPTDMETAGWVDTGDGVTVTTVQVAHNQELHERFIDEVGDESMSVNQSLHGIAAGLYETLNDGVVGEDITRTVAERVEQSVDPALSKPTDGDARPSDAGFELRTRDVSIGTVQYRVDGIVPPERIAD